MVIGAIAAVLPTSACREAPPATGPSFAPVQPELFATPGALTNAWADVDRDGDPDLFVGFNGSPNRLYRNDEGTFFDVASRMGIDDARATRTSAWGDFDSDGDPDLLVGFVPGEEPILKLYRNDGDTFVDVAAEMGLDLVAGTTRQASWVDWDADGDLDLFLAFRDRANALFLNEAGRFRDVAQRVGVADARRTVGAVWFDYEEDGDLDLLVANMDGDANGLFRNDGGSFTDVAPDIGLADGGRGLGDPALGTVRPCLTDFDNDGTVDLFFANYGPNALFRRGTDRNWRNVAPNLGLAVDGRYDTCAFGDFDNDGKEDLFVNGTITGGTQYRDYLFRNEASSFVDVTPEELLATDADHGAQWVDFDRDGALDLSLAGATDSGMHYVMRNLAGSAARGRSLAVRVVDERGMETLAGAEVKIYERGTGALLGTRVVDTGSGYDSQNSLPVYFGLPPGLPSEGHVDIRVRFPAAGLSRLATMEDVDPRAFVGRAVTVEMPPVGGAAPSSGSGSAGSDRP